MALALAPFTRFKAGSSLKAPSKVLPTFAYYGFVWIEFIVSEIENYKLKVL